MQRDKPLIYLSAACIASGLIFTIFPQIDLWAASLFFGPEGFALANDPFLQKLRNTLWRLSVLVPIALLGLILAGFVLRRLRAAVCLGPLAFMLLGPGLLVNGLLKAYWGRARPADVTEFGGLAQFTPPLTITDQCLRNCSFVSGEGAGIVAISLVIFFLLSRWLSPGAQQALVVGLIVLCIAGAGLRVAMGRHFLSDVIFAALFMAILFRLMLPLFRRLEHWGAGGWCLLPARHPPNPGRAPDQP